jgi:hypothetical protein
VDILTFHDEKGANADMKRMAVVGLVVSALLPLTLWTPASAQVVPPDRNAIDFRVATFSGSPVYSVGFSWGFTPVLDLNIAYNTQSGGGNLLDAGVRYHFRVPTPGVDIFLSGGLASVTAPFPGFGANGTGLALGGGASVRLTDLLVGYADISLMSVGGGSNSVFDLGVQLQFGPRLSGQLGYINFAGSGAPYLGLNLNLPGLQ